MEYEPVVVLQGPRAVGKTTLLHSLADSFGSAIEDLDDLATRDACDADPALFVAGDPPVMIDEYQHVPQVLDAIKAELNRDGSPGRFVLAGSTRHDALPIAAQALTGRIHVVDVFPLSQGEISGVKETFIEDLLERPERLLDDRTPGSDRREYADRVCRGGFPVALARTGPARSRWIDNYVTLTLERDAQFLRRIQHGDVLPKLLSRLAGQTAQVMNLNSIAGDLGLDRKTLVGYVDLLEKIFLVKQLPAWGTTLSARSAKSPKIHVVDSGVAARLLRVGPEKLASRDAAAMQQFGHLLETFAVGECRKQLSWREDEVLTGHWRTHDGDEVDLVIEDDHGRVVGVEVKAASRVRSSDASGLRLLRDKLAERFVAGVVLYTGERSYPLDDKIFVLPLDRLWTQG